MSLTSRIHDPWVGEAPWKKWKSKAKMEHSEFWSQRSVLQLKRNRLLLGDLPGVWVGPPHTQITTPETPLWARITSGLLHPHDYKLTCVARGNHGLWHFHKRSHAAPESCHPLRLCVESSLLGFAKTSTSVESMPPRYLFGVDTVKRLSSDTLVFIGGSIEWHHRTGTSVSGSYQSSIPACSSSWDLLWHDSRLDHLHNPGLQESQFPP